MVSILFFQMFANKVQSFKNILQHSKNALVICNNLICLTLCLILRGIKIKGK